MVLVPPPVFAVAAAVAQRALSRGGSTPGVLRATAAATVVLGSGFLAASTANRFRRSGTTVEPFHPERASVLVTSGANSVTRNPMYVGLAGLLLANAIRTGSWGALVPVAGFVVAIDRLQVAAEESALAAKFGADYAAYCATVPRWLDRRSVQAMRPG